VELLPLLWEIQTGRLKFSLLGDKYSILAHPFVPGMEIAEALIILFASMLLASCNAPRTFNGNFRHLKEIGAIRLRLQI